MDESIKDNNLSKDPTTAIIKYNPELFHNDKNIFLIYKKIQNLNGALFLITNLIPDTEILKANIRQQGLTNLSTVSSIVGTQSLNVATLQVINGQILYTASLLDIAFWTGLITEMNISILKTELAALNQLLNETIQKYKNKFFINSTFFQADLNELAPADSGVFSQRHFSANINSKDSFRNQALDTKGHYKRHSIKDTVKDISRGNNSQSISSKSSDSKNNRRQVILNLLAKKSNLSIKDFSAVIADYSEKTIQRELLALVDEGILKKEGERRWSTYSLAQ